MVSIESPYTPGEMATFTPGRERERDNYFQLLVSTAGTGKFQGRIQVLQGARGVGKTSLLRAVQRRADTLGLTTVFITASATEGLSLLGHGLAERLAEFEPTSLTDQFTAAISTIGVRLGPAEVGLDVTRRTSPPGAVSNLKRALRTVAASTAKARRGLAIFVDEIQEMPPADIFTLAAAWQELDAESKAVKKDRLAAVLFTAGLSNSQEIITSGASFGERFKFSTVGNLDHEAATQALVEPALELGVSWDAAAVDAVLSTSSGYPYFLQLYAHETWDSVARLEGDRISVADTRSGIDAAVPQIDTFYRGRWNKATPAEQKLLVAIARSGNEELRRGDLAERMGVATTDISMVRASLLGKGLITVPRHGWLAFNAPGFGNFILNEIEG